MIHYLNDNGLKNSGAYGCYFKWRPKIGIKVVETASSYNLDSLKFRLLHKDLFVVFLESIYFNLMYGSGTSKVVLCKKTSKDIKKQTIYHLGIKMPHLRGRFIDIRKCFLTKDKKITRKRTSNPLIVEILKKYEKKKIFNHDINNENVVLFENEIKPIDFSPDQIQYYGSKTSFRKELNVILKLFRKEFQRNCFGRFPEKSLKKIIENHIKIT